MDHEQAHIVPYHTLIKVWAALLALTLLLASSSKIFHGALSAWAMLLLSPLKASLVFYYFMHLKYEGPLLKSLVVVALATLVVFMGMLFFDISFR